MIQFYKITDEHGKVFYNGSQIGIYKNFNYLKEVCLEIGYSSLTISYKNKHLIKDLALKIHVRQKARLKRTMIKEHKLRNSIYNR